MNKTGMAALVFGIFAGVSLQAHAFFGAYPSMQDDGPKNLPSVKKNKDQYQPIYINSEQDRMSAQTRKALAMQTYYSYPKIGDWELLEIALGRQQIGSLSTNAFAKQEFLEKNAGLLKEIKSARPMTKVKVISAMPPAFSLNNYDFGVGAFVFDSSDVKNAQDLNRRYVVKMPDADSNGNIRYKLDKGVAKTVANKPNMTQTIIYGTVLKQKDTGDWVPHLQVDAIEVCLDNGTDAEKENRRYRKGWGDSPSINLSNCQFIDGSEIKFQ